MTYQIFISGYNKMIQLADLVMSKIRLPEGVSIKTTTQLAEMINQHIDHPKSDVFFEKFPPRSIVIHDEQTASILRKLIKVPVIPIKISGFDLMKILLEGSKYGEEIAVVNYLVRFPILDDFSSILKVRIRQYQCAHEEEAAKVIDELKDSGCRVVVGGSIACEMAERYGLKGIFIYSSSAMEAAIAHALEMIAVSRQETERYNSLRAIVDYASSGIISTDKNSRINMFNSTAERILGIHSKDVVGKDFSAIFPDFQVERSGEIVRPKVNHLGSFGKVKVVFSSVPIMVSGKPRGQVTEIHETSAIQMVEEKIRREAHKKPFMAQHSLHSIIGESPVIIKAIEKATKFGKLDSAVLITGETGTGKELFAQGIHRCSPRQEKPFVAINCAALPESLLDSELFGYEQGAFTGARKDGKPGLFELAHTGTIFLDEIGETSLAVQARLLRVLQEKEVMRIGGKRIIPVDVRVISATNRNLWEMVQRGRFREDLYYRLNVLELNIPPLRYRSEDLPDLVRTFLRRSAPNILISANDLVVNAFDELKGYSWPGNIRELENLLERFIALANEVTPSLETYKQVLLDSVHPEIQRLLPGEKTNPVIRKVNTAEPEEILRVLGETNSKTKTAEILGMSRSTLYRKLRKGGA